MLRRSLIRTIQNNGVSKQLSLEIVKGIFRATSGKGCPTQSQIGAPPMLCSSDELRFSCVQLDRITRSHVSTRHLPETQAQFGDVRSSPAFSNHIIFRYSNKCGSGFATQTPKEHPDRGFGCSEMLGGVCRNGWMHLNKWETFPQLVISCSSAEPDTAILPTHQSNLWAVRYHWTH